MPIGFVCSFIYNKQQKKKKNFVYGASKEVYDTLKNNLRNNIQNTMYKSSFEIVYRPNCKKL